jgi:hypothetical protein
MVVNTLGLTPVVSTKRAVLSENICFIFVKVQIMLPKYLIKGRATDCSEIGSQRRLTPCIPGTRLPKYAMHT